MWLVNGHVVFMLQMVGQFTRTLSPDGNQIVSKTYMTRAVRKLEVASSCAPSACLPQVEGENTRLRYYLARLHRKTLCYSKSKVMLEHSIRLLIHYLKFWDVPVRYVEKFPDF
ncbi:IS1 transposase [Stanieria sp. NIES-3757]|nr:IS1 transposase [Stanieria sp. NIES-3757]